MVYTDFLLSDARQNISGRQIILRAKAVKTRAECKRGRDALIAFCEVA